MRRISAFFQLIRYNNLLIIAFTQLIIWFLLLNPFFKSIEIRPLLSIFNILSLVLSTVSIAAAGYIINDYFDFSIDIINKPDKVIIEKVIPRRHAILLHSILNFLGISLAVYVAFQAGNWALILLPISCSLLLWFYATDFKGSYIYGNIIIALLTVFSIAIIPFFEVKMWEYFTWNLWIQNGVINPWFVLSVYMFFAFILTWIREIVKDMEDIKGDLLQDCKTLPIVIGLKKAGNFSKILILIANSVLFLSSIILFFSRWWSLGLYLLLFLILPLFYVFFKINSSGMQKHYHAMSRLLKIIMFFGILALLIIYLLFNQEF